MKKIFIGIFSFSISALVGYQFLRIPGSQAPRFHGEEFSGGSMLTIMALVYSIMYIVACIFFTMKFSRSQKAKYIVRLLCFFGVTALIGFAFNKYYFGQYDPIQY